MRVPGFGFFSVSLAIIGLMLLVFSFPAADLSKDHYVKEIFFRLKQENGTAQNLNSFERIDAGTAFELTYGWMDYERGSHFVKFLISKKVLREAEDEFGYYEEGLEKFAEESVGRMRKEMIIYLKEFTAQLIAKSAYSQYILIEEVDAENFKLKLSVPPPLYDEVKAEYERIKALLADEQNSYLGKIEKEKEKSKKNFLERRGLRTFGDQIGVNYQFCVQNNRPRMKHVLEAMMNIDPRLNLRQFLALLLAFIQEIRYGIPPIKDNNKFILGLWVPPKVLVNNFGDCDSKGVTFASLWTNFKKYPFLLIKIPDHMFVGLAIPSFSQEGVTINGLRYTLCEVTGPDKVPPGLITPYSEFYLQGGHFRYEIVR